MTWAVRRLVGLTAAVSRRGAHGRMRRGRLHGVFDGRPQIWPCARARQIWPLSFSSMTSAAFLPLD